RIQGYELDSQAANKVLAGKIDNPNNEHSGDVMNVASGRDGTGLKLDFVDPVKKKEPKGEVSLDKPVVISWESYPKASTYRLQLVERKAPRDYAGEQRLFRWSQRPLVSTTSADPANHGVTLKK